MERNRGQRESRPADLAGCLAGLFTNKRNLETGTVDVKYDAFKLAWRSTVCARL